MNVTRPVLRYHGGKWKCADKIIAAMPPHDTYIEPFGGGASVLLRKPRSKCEVYNDLDGEIVNFFKVVRDNPDELVRAIELTPYSRKEFLGSYRPSNDPVEQARRTAIRSFMSYGTGLTRVCTDGRRMRSGFRGTRREKTCSSHDWRRLPPNIVAVAERLRGVVIEQKDAIAVMLTYDVDGAVHYVDPPYVHSTRADAKNGRHGYAHELTDEQHRDLVKVLNELRGAVLVSGYHSALYDELFAGWERIEWGAHSVNARPTKEVLWTRNCDHGLFA